MAAPPRTKPFVGGSFARIDQGVDWQQTSPYVSVGNGTVVKVSPKGSWRGGTGAAVYIRLDNPIKINGRVYTEVYYAEQNPLVKKGQRVKAGQPVMEGGGAELGFAKNGSPVAPLVGGFGSGTQATQPGHDFMEFVQGAGTQLGSSKATHVSPVQDLGGSSASPGNSPQLDFGSYVAPPTAFGQPGADVEMPGSQNFSVPPPGGSDAYSLWSQVGQGNLVSTDTQQMIANAQFAVNPPPPLGANGK